VSLPDAMLLSLLQGLYGELDAVKRALEEMRVSNQQQEANLNAALDRIEAAVGAVQAEVSAAAAELGRLRTDLANRTEVDLSQEVARADAVAKRLSDAEQALDAAANPPAAPA
jgi:predicted  nucleic acid-binding Zn-ribbon protein